MDRKDTGSYIWSYHEETPSERKLAQALKKARIVFVREAPVKNYSVDFLIDQWLVVEVDGESHLISGRAEKDKHRQQKLEKAGFYVLRIPAGEISTKRGLRKWVNSIENTLKTRDPGSYGSSGNKLNNEVWKNKVKSVKKEMERQKALEYGRREREKKTGQVFGSKRQAIDDDKETMENYFGDKADDFRSLLEEYDWDNNRKNKRKSK